MDLYPIEAQGVIDKDTLTRLRKYLIPLYVYPVSTIMGIVFLCMAFYHIERSLTLAIFFLCCALSMYLLYRYMLVAVVNQYLDIVEVFCNTRSLVYDLQFLEENLYLSVLGEEKPPAEISYQSIQMIIETKSVYIMVADLGVPIFAEKKSFKNITLIEWNDFLNRKCKNAKQIKFVKH